MGHNPAQIAILPNGQHLIACSTDCAYDLMAEIDEKDLVSMDSFVPIPRGYKVQACVHCHTCGRLLKAPKHCPLHDECPSWWWLGSIQARDFVASWQMLTNYPVLPNHAWIEAESVAEDNPLVPGEIIARTILE